MVRKRRFAIAAVTAGTALALTGAPAFAIAAEVESAAISSTAASTVNLPKAIEFHKVTEGVESGQTYSLVSTNQPSAGNPRRILHLSTNPNRLDRCIAQTAVDKLTPVDCVVEAYRGKHAHEWLFEEVEGGFTIKAQSSDHPYINLTGSGASLSANPQTFTVEKGSNGSLRLSAMVGDAKRYLSYGNSGWTSAATAYDILIFKRVEVLPTVVPNHKDTTGATQGRPFAPGTGGSGEFRIPSLITSGDGGTLYAAIDARWNHTMDACGLDTIFSRSTDGGENWTFSFANYFPDSTDAANNEATAFIDPLMVEKDGVLYMIVDLWPGGVAINSARHTSPVKASGFVAIDGVPRLVLYDSPDPSRQREAGAERGAGYTHYIGDFDESGYAPVIKADTKATTHYVDREYYLFDENKMPMYCRQLGNDSAYVQQNIFFYRAELHATAVSHLMLKTSRDGGRTWSAPTLLNSQVRTGEKEPLTSFYGLGPGRGLVTSTGRIVVPCYTFTSGQGDGKTSVIYSDDGSTWHRGEPLDHTTSEATVVEVDGSLYMFARHGWYAVSHDGGETWQDEKSLPGSGINVYTNCQINAIRYSKFIDGKPAILLSCPTGDRRAGGTIFIGLVDENGGIEWRYRRRVTDESTFFAYSCLTELNDGSVGLLWEGVSDESFFSHYQISDIAPGAQVSNRRQLTVPLYGSLELKVSAALTGFEGVDSSIAKVTLEKGDETHATLRVEGVGEGEVSFTDPVSKMEYVIAVEPSKLVEMTVEMGEKGLAGASADPITRQPDPSIATAEIVTRPYVEAWGESAGVLGSDATFSGDAVRMSASLYEFTKTGDNWTVKGQAADGSDVFLNLSGTKLTSPNKGSGNPIELKPQPDGTFKLYDTQVRSHLHFDRSGKAHFDRCGTTCAGDNFELYRRVQDGETASAEVPGYARVTSVDDVASGQSYLIVAEAGGTRFALHPAAEGSAQHAHVVKVDPELVEHRLQVTPVSPGKTDIAVGDVVYRVTVAGYLAPTFTWAEDHSSARATFEHTGDGKTVVLDCEVTSERIEPTATEDGKVVYTAEVTFQGKVHRDRRTVVLPATGEPGGGGQGGGQGQGSGPDVDQGGQPGGATGAPGDQVGGQPGGHAGSSGQAVGNGDGSNAALPGTGDPAAVAGGVSLLGALLGGLGVKLRKREG